MWADPLFWRTKLAVLLWLHFKISWESLKKKKQWGEEGRKPNPHDDRPGVTSCLGFARVREGNGTPP